MEWRLQRAPEYPKPRERMTRIDQVEKFYTTYIDSVDLQVLERSLYDARAFIFQDVE